MTHMDQSIKIATKFLKYSMGLAFILIACQVMLAGSDDTPPYLVNPIPENGAVDIPTGVTVKVTLVDDDSGVDINPDSVKFILNGTPPEVQPIIDPFYENEKQAAHIYCELPFGAYPPGSVIRVEVEARDLAATPNVMTDGWTFKLSTTEVDYRVIPLTPVDMSWLHIKAKNGLAYFSWSTGWNQDSYRFRLNLTDGTSYTADVGSNICERGFGVVSMGIKLTPDQWKSMDELGIATWQVAPLEKEKGKILAEYSKANVVHFMSDPLSPLLETPVDGGILNPSVRPVFRWNRPAMAEEFLFIMVRKDSNGNITDDITTEFLPAFLNEVTFSQSTWDSFLPGEWYWSVLAIFPDGSYSDYMLRSFYKLNEE